MTDQEWKKFLDEHLVKMKLEHEAFMREARRRFLFGAAVTVALYFGAQLVVYMILGKVTWP